MPSRDENWNRVRTVEDALAILNKIEQRRRIIRYQLWKEGDLATAYVEATKMQGDLSKLKETLSERWEELFRQAREKDK